MLNTIKRISTYLLFTLISIGVYGVALFFAFSWLARFSLLHAYIGNLVFIFAVLAIDEYFLRALQSEKALMQIKRIKNSEENRRSLQRGLNSVGSFKSDLYLLYVIILVFSQITEFAPSLVSEKLGSFLRANDYSILLLVAFDTLLGQISKDRKKVKKILANLEGSLTDNQE